MQSAMLTSFPGKCNKASWCKTNIEMSWITSTKMSRTHLQAHTHTYTHTHTW